MFTKSRDLDIENPNVGTAAIRARAFPVTPRPLRVCITH
jgi:hypothetical protein